MQDMLNKISLSQLRLLTIGVAAIVLASMIVGMLVPTAKEMLAASNTVDILKAASQDGKELERHLREEDQKIQNLKFRLYGDMANLPVKQVEAYIIGRLQEMSWENKVELVSVEPALGEQVKIFQEMLFNVQLVGQYDDLYRWLWDVRNDLGFVVIKEYRLSRRDDSDDEPTLLADLSLASYRAVE